ncbi:hypothetical protein [Streptomyces sp. NPDC006739]|uniref:hypothetical protein n=1 Tax=Streptomyces sp. NPDC006739 TaxID=3364763 RepID=UPI0036810A17
MSTEAWHAPVPPREDRSEEFTSRGFRSADDESDEEPSVFTPRFPRLRPSDPTAPPPPPASARFPDTPPPAGATRRDTATSEPGTDAGDATPATRRGAGGAAVVPQRPSAPPPGGGASPGGAGGTASGRPGASSTGSEPRRDGAPPAPLEPPRPLTSPEGRESDGGGVTGVPPRAGVSPTGRGADRGGVTGVPPRAGVSPTGRGADRGGATGVPPRPTVPPASQEGDRTGAAVVPPRPGAAPAGRAGDRTGTSSATPAGREAGRADGVSSEGRERTVPPRPAYRPGVAEANARPRPVPSAAEPEATLSGRGAEHDPQVAWSPVGSVRTAGASMSAATRISPDPTLSWGAPVVSFGEPEGYDERGRARPLGGRVRPRTAAAAACVVLGLGLIGGAVAGSWLTGGGDGAATATSFGTAAALWHDMPVDQLFPPTVQGTGAGPGGADRTWTRIAVAPDSGCADAFDPLLHRALAPVGCQRLLRATYTDATQSYVTTVGLLFTKADAAAMSALAARFGDEHLDRRTDLMPRPYAAKDTVAAGFGDKQRASWTISVLTDVPVVAYAVSGWADGRTVDAPQPAADATQSGATTAPAQAGLGNEAQGLADRIERGLRKTASTATEKPS